MRKIFTFMFALMAGVGMINAEIIESVQIGDFYYNLDTEKQTAEVTIRSCSIGNIIIPSSITYNGTPFHVTSIGIHAFLECSNLISVEIPNSVTSIGLEAFYGCTGLTSVTIPNSVTSIGTSAFYGCSALTSIEIPNSVTSIGVWAFHNCTGLTSVTIPNSVTSIGTYAFEGCSGLKDVSLPNSLTSVGGVLFVNCKALETIMIPDLETWIRIGGGYVISSLDYPSYNLYINQELLIDLELPETVKSITSELFQGCVSLQTVNIPNSVTRIGQDAFKNCINLADVSIGDNVTYIGSHAFAGTALTSIIIPNHVDTIKEYAFGQCENLKLVNIGESVVTIWAAFNGCNSIDSIIWSAERCREVASGSIESTFHDSHSSIKLCDFRERTEIIPVGMCADFDALTSIIIPASVTEIGSWAFAYCTSLEVVYNNATTPQPITRDVFNGVDISKCRLVVPAGSIALYKAADVWKEFIIEEKWCIGGYGMSGEEAGWTLSCDSTIVEINGKGEMFNYERDEAPWYKHNDKMQYVIFTKGITYVGDNAFAGCSNVKKITCKATTPPICGVAVFDNINKSQCILVVPWGTVELYKAADVWKEFFIEEDVDSQEQPEAVTIAQALEIGQGLEVKETFETDLTIVGYVVGVETEFDSQKRNQTYWIADTQYGKATGALYIYRGACDKEVKRGYKVSIQGKITRYTDLVIETVEKAQVTILDETETDEPTILWGKCGAEGDSTNLSWQLNLSTWTLDIQGSGPMADSLQYLPWHSQNYRNSITAVNLPDGLTTIGLGAFEYCKKLTSITIPETVNLIGKWAFYNCTNLTSLNIPESVHAFGLYAFVGIAVPKPLMNSRFFCFMPREYSGKYTIPEGITNIISFAFERCIKLTEVIIPSSAKDLGYSAFGSCTALQSITSLAVNPPACREEMSFKDVDKSIPVYVPAESIDAYKAAGEWKEFENIQPIQAEEVPVTEIEAEPTYNSVVIEWPKVAEATVYTIEIRKDGELVCTLTFNEQGQLQGITFAKPSRNGGRNSQVRMAIQTATGWQYTISGLDPDTEYTYSVVAKKNAGDTETLFSDSVTFTTKQTPTGVDEVSDQPSEVRKLLRNGQLLINHNGEIFNAQGARVE